MTKQDSRKLLGINAGIWMAATLASFILPLVVKPMTTGDAPFLRLLVQVGPLLAGMWLTHVVFSKALSEG